MLPGPTSAGSAFWQGNPGVAPVYTGDSFAFTLLSSFGAFQTNQLQMMRMGVSMAKKMFTPDTETSETAK